MQARALSRGPLTGQKFALAGSFPTLTHQDLRGRIAHNGGIVIELEEVDGADVNVILGRGVGPYMARHLSYWGTRIFSEPHHLQWLLDLPAPRPAGMESQNEIQAEPIAASAVGLSMTEPTFITTKRKKESPAPLSENPNPAGSNKRVKMAEKMEIIDLTEN